MIRSQLNRLLYGERDYLEPASIPKYINQLDKSYIYHPIMTNHRLMINHRMIRKKQILPQGYPKTPVIGCACLVNAYNRKYNSPTMDLPSAKYEYPIIIEDCSFYKDGSLINSGEIILVNGKVWPNLDIKRRQYRFYILNGSVSRFFKLILSNEMSFTVIGGDKGLLYSPIRKKEILLAPGEIVDILIDFSRQPKGSKIIVKNEASRPYPNGYLPNPETSGQIMRFSIPENDAISIAPLKLPDKLRL